jgi:fructokinase
MKVLSIGEVVVDWLARDIGRPLNEQSDFCRQVGGNAANVAIGLARLGLQSCLIGKVGQDFHAEYLRMSLEKEGVDLSAVITDPRYGTTQCYITTRADSSHSFIEWPRPHAAQMLAADEVNPAHFDSSWAICATGISMTYEPRRGAIERAIDLAVKNNLIISFDGSMPSDADDKAKEATEKILAKAHILKFNEHELCFWSDNHTADIETAAKLLFARYRPQVLCATASSRGAFIVTEKCFLPIKAYSVKAVDEVGAGDAFVAGIIAGIHAKLAARESLTAANLQSLNAEDWHMVGHMASACGALATTKLGAVASLPTEAEAKSLISSNLRA